MSDDLVDHYGTDGFEDTRLRRSAHGRLEYLRTQELIRRHLPSAAGLRILDVGGATGIHAAWLAADGHKVHVVDPVPTHVSAARHLPGVTAQVGDARSLDVPATTYDVVMLMGPLYHLTSSTDRAQALSEARRVLRPGGLLVAAGISRYLSLLELGTTGRLTADLEPSLRTALSTGSYDGHVGFLPSHFHTADQLQSEIASAGFPTPTVYGVEGPTWPSLDVAGLPAFDTLVDAALRCARLVEQDPALINASAHFLAFTETARP
ncbi:class I SAM-dependent methyltransferase [Paractinoplanes ferrugineus]|uniref:SAM-dependent methyltransferase n=1 Tax=Paractinoplanes ferrugineus TaxID=113564 RepID=A0A919J163_9ACTN|nr:class I SAM-dependent methyltransferase [Actinoplanes ferrugineus]GIE11819.1 SAM-dependent methyltransferase [Actinoplanes ferrugineus]